MVRRPSRERVCRLHLPEPHAFAVRPPGRDVAAGNTGLALWHLLLRAALPTMTRGAPSENFPASGELASARSRALQHEYNLQEGVRREDFLINQVCPKMVVHCGICVICIPPESA